MLLAVKDVVLKDPETCYTYDTILTTNIGEEIKGVDPPPNYTRNALTLFKNLKIPEHEKNILNVGYKGGNQLLITGSKKINETWQEAMKRELMEEISCGVLGGDDMLVYENFTKQPYTCYFINITNLKICEPNFNIDLRPDEVREGRIKSKIIILVYGSREKMKKFLEKSKIYKENIDLITTMFVIDINTCFSLIKASSLKEKLKKAESPPILKIKDSIDIEDLEDESINTVEDDLRESIDNIQININISDEDDQDED